MRARGLAPRTTLPATRVYKSAGGRGRREGEWGGGEKESVRGKQLDASDVGPSQKTTDAARPMATVNATAGRLCRRAATRSGHADIVRERTRRRRLQSPPTACRRQRDLSWWQVARPGLTHRARGVEQQRRGRARAPEGMRFEMPKGIVDGSAKDRCARNETHVRACLALAGHRAPA